jgi:hypothetical protein
MAARRIPRGSHGPAAQLADLSPPRTLARPGGSNSSVLSDSSSLVAQRLSIPRITGLERFVVEVRSRPLPRHGTDHDSKPLPSLPRFRLPVRHFSADKKSIEVVVRPRKVRPRCPPRTFSLPLASTPSEPKFWVTSPQNKPYPNPLKHLRRSPAPKRLGFLPSTYKLK